MAQTPDVPAPGASGREEACQGGSVSSSRNVQWVANLACRARGASPAVTWPSGAADLGEGERQTPPALGTWMASLSRPEPLHGAGQWAAHSLLDPRPRPARNRPSLTRRQPCLHHTPYGWFPKSPPCHFKEGCGSSCRERRPALPWSAEPGRPRAEVSQGRLELKPHPEEVPPQGP